MFSVNWLTLLLFITAFVLIALGLHGTYGQVWGAITSIPLTPAQTQAQTTQAQAPTNAPFQRIG